MVNKITSPITPLGEIDKINEIIDELGSASVAIDNSTITKNTSDQLQTVAVKDNRSGNAIKTWTGTKAQYDAIATKDATTLYNIIDDTDVTLPILELLYPVGSLYIATANVSVCPLAVLGVGTWQQKANSTLVTNVSGTAPVIGNGMTLGLVGKNNSTGGLVADGGSGYYLQANTGCYGLPQGSYNTTTTGNMKTSTFGVTTDPTKSGLEANITSTTLSVTIWERVS